MTTPWIITSKMVAPAPPAGMLSREWAQGAWTGPPVTLLVAGAGYGKTLGLVALSEQAARHGAATVWLSLDGDDADPAVFFPYLVAALRRQIPPFGQDFPAPSAAATMEPRVLWQRVFQELATFGAPICLAIDDCQHLIAAAPAILTGLAQHLDRLPEGLTLLLASRRRLPFPLARHEAAGRVRALGPERLRFTSEEEVAFMRGRAPDGAIPNWWWKQATGLDGWPLGLDLATRATPIQTPFAAEGEAGPGSAALTAYVAEELYQTQPPDQRAFMIQASMLPEPTAEACRAIFGAHDAAGRLESLESDHLMRRLADGTGYRFPLYVQEFLQREAVRTVPEDEQRGWHHEAGAYYRARGQAEQAIPHLIAARDWAGALVVCQACFPAMLVDGRQAVIERCLAAFPPEQAAGAPTWQLWRGNCLAHDGRHDEARRCYDQARALFGTLEDAAGELKAVVRLCTLALLTQEPKRFAQLLLQSQALLAQGRPEDQADLHLLRALAAERRGDLALMRECNESVLAIDAAGNVEAATCRCLALFNMFTWALHHGDLGAARRAIEEVITWAGEWQFRPYHLSASFMAAQLDLLEGDLAAAGAFVRGLPERWVERLEWHDQGCAYAILGHYHAACSAWKEAQLALERSQAIFERAGFPEGRKIAWERLIWLAIQRRQYDRAREIFRDAGELGADNVFDLALVVANGRALHLEGKYDAALDVWQGVIPALSALGAQLYLTRSRLYEAATRLRLADADGAMQAFKVASAAIETRHYGFLAAQDPLLWQELRPLTEPEPESKLAPSITSAPPPAAPAAPSVSVLSASGQLLEVRLFGNLEIRQGGILLDQWPRRKARLMIAALALHPRGLSPAMLAELVGEDSETPAFIATVRVNIMTLRKVLEPDLGKRADSRYVLFEADRYALAPHMVGLLDGQVFTEAMAQGDHAAALDAERAAAGYDQALAVYRGNLLEDGALAGFFDAEREHFRRQALRALYWLADYHHSRAQYAQAGALLMRGAALAPCEEEAYVRLMRHHLQAGRPERVRQAYWDYRKALKAKLGIMPSDAFEAAYREIGGIKQA